MAIPLSPEEEARALAYYGGTPGQNMSSAAAPPPPPPPPPDPSAYFGPPRPPPPGAAPPPPAVDPFAAGAAKMGIAPPQGDRVYNDIGVDPSQIKGISLAEAPRGVQLAPKPPPPVTAPIGPSAADNAAFEAFKASQAKAHPAVSTGGGGGAKPNPDPFGIKAAGDKAVASYDTQAGAAQRLGDDEAYKAQQIGLHQAEQARRRIEDADLEQAHADVAAKRLDDSIQETQRQIDDVRAKKIQPLAYMHEQPALGMMAIAGAVMGGVYQWATGTHENPFLAEMNRQLDRQIAVDEKNINNEKDALQGKMNLLQQQRAIYHDDQTARLAAKNLYYEAFKEQLAGEAQQYDSPMYKDRAAGAIAELNRGQALLQKQLGEQLRSQAMAGAASALARQKEVIEAYRSTYDKALSAGYSPAIAEAEARRMIGVLYNGEGGTPRPPEAPDATGGMTKEQRGKIAAERYEAQTASDEFNAQIDALKKHPAIQADSITAGPMSNLGGRMAPESSKYVQDLDMAGVRLLQAVGKVAKDADGKPNVHMQEEIKRVYMPRPGDTPAQKLQKLEGARDAVNALARQQGALGAPKPGAAQETANRLGFKPMGR